MWSLQDEFSKVTKKLNDQDKIIKTLKSSNAVQKQKLAQLADGPGVVATTKKKSIPKQGSNLKGFLSTQLREEIEGTEEILVIDDPDSTTGGTKKKKKKKKKATKRDEESEESNASDVLAWSQRPQKRHHISSDRSSVPGYEPPSPKGQESEEESGNEDEVKKLLNECDAVEDKLAEMQRKMEGLEWSERVRGYQVTIEKCVVLFRMAAIKDYGNKKESQELLDTRGDMKWVTRTLQQNGFTLRVCEDFVDRVEKTVRAGFIPEQRISMKVMDNCADDPVQGYMHDVTYSLDIPVVVKQEKADEDDDLEIVVVTPATKNIIDVLKVQTEKMTSPMSPEKHVTGGETSTSPKKGKTEDSGTSPQKDSTEDNPMAPNKDVTEDSGTSPQKSSTPQKVKPKPQKTLGTMNTRTLRSHKRWETLPDLTKTMFLYFRSICGAEM